MTSVDGSHLLDATHVHHDDLVLPDGVHGFLRFRSSVTADAATAAWFAAGFGRR